MIVGGYRWGGVQYDAALMFDRSKRVSWIELSTKGRERCQRIGRKLYARLDKLIDHNMTGDNSMYLWKLKRPSSYIEYRDLWTRPYDPQPPSYTCRITTTYAPEMTLSVAIRM